MNLLRWVVRLVEDLGERYRIGATFGAILLGGFYVAHHVGQSTRGGQAAAQLAFWFAILGSVWIAGLLHRLKKERNLREYERLEREVLQPAREAARGVTDTLDEAVSTAPAREADRRVREKANATEESSNNHAHR